MTNKAKTTIIMFVAVFLCASLLLTPAMAKTCKEGKTGIVQKSFVYRNLYSSNAICPYVIKNSVKNKDMKHLDGIMRIMETSNPNIPLHKKNEYGNVILKWSAFYNLDPVLVSAVIHKESNFKENCVYLGNYGCMQVNYSAHKSYLKKMGVGRNDLKTIDIGVQMGCKVLKDCMTATKGNISKALYRYNGCNNPKYVAGVLKMYKHGKSV